MSKEFSVGQRIIVEKWKATVRYIGEVHGQKDIWVGLEWDDKSRGKHDGSTGGSRYFLTKNGEKSGSFIRESKLQLTANTGQTLLEAMKEKYENEDFELRGDDENLQLNGKVKFELVGMKKMREQRGGIEKLEDVSLIDSCISSAGPSGELRQASPNLRGIDLSSNLLCTWDEVMLICKELPKLEILNLSENRLQLPDNCANFPVHNLRCLVLNNCKLQGWKIAQCLHKFPHLKELHLVGNGLQNVEIDIDKCGQNLQHLKKLDLARNKIQDWAEICKLASLTSLEDLILDDNGILRIQTHSPSNTPIFNSLKGLVLAGNEISDWASVNALNQYRSLTSLRLNGNPQPLSSQANRYQVIARLGSLKALNGSLLSESHRKDAEIQYLRVIQGSVTTANEDNLLKEHPRLNELKAKYGDVGASICLDGKPKSLSSHMIDVTISCNESRVENGEIVKKLPGSLKLGKLKALCAKLFKLPARQQVIFHKINESEEDNITGCEARQLSYFADQGQLALRIVDGG